MEKEINKFDIFVDSRGHLIPIDFNLLPFTPQRIFCVSNVPPNTIRGHHAHYETSQILICLSGNIQVSLHDGTLEKQFNLEQGDSIFVDRLIWDSQKFLSENSTLLVICSTQYNIDDYITNFDEFLIMKNN